jgi:hypothetical protein
MSPFPGSSDKPSLYKTDSFISSTSPGQGENKNINSDQRNTSKGTDFESVVENRKRNLEDKNGFMVSAGTSSLEEIYYKL